MVIHTVQPNETINSIAEMYGVSADKLITDNSISNPSQLVVGQSLAILYPKETYIVQEGDSLEGIAASHGVQAVQLLQNNPQLSNQAYIYPGEEIVISYTDEKRMALSTNGYAFPFIDINILRETLPYLTYLTVFYYRITMNGDLVDIRDKLLIETARAYGVAPIMTISTITEEGDINEQATHSIVTDKNKQENLINQVLDNMNRKNYYGLNIDMQNIYPEDRQLYVDFISNISGRIIQAGYYVSSTLTPITFPTDNNVIYQGPEYAILGQLTDSTMLLSYAWGHAHSPQPALPLSWVRTLLDYFATQIPPEKIFLGIPTIGYIWQLPFLLNYTIANSITHNAALTLANEVGATIERDESSQAPFFHYVTDSAYVVWFRDVRSTAALLDIVTEYGLEGIGTWNIMQFASGMWLLISTQYDIRKIEGLQNPPSESI